MVHDTKPRRRENERETRARESKEVPECAHERKIERKEESVRERMREREREREREEEHVQDFVNERPWDCRVRARARG